MVRILRGLHLPHDLLRVPPLSSSPRHCFCSGHRGLSAGAQAQQVHSLPADLCPFRSLCLEHFLPHATRSRPHLPTSLPQWAPREALPDHSPSRAVLRLPVPRLRSLVFRPRLSIRPSIKSRVACLRVNSIRAEEAGLVFCTAARHRCPGISVNGMGARMRRTLADTEGPLWVSPRLAQPPSRRAHLCRGSVRHRHHRGPE